MNEGVWAVERINFDLDHSINGYAHIVRQFRNYKISALCETIAPLQLQI